MAKAPNSSAKSNRIPQKPLVVMVTGFGSVESAVDCMRNGAFDYMLKPFSSDQLEVTLKKAENFNQLLKVNAYFNHAEEDDAGTPNCSAKAPAHAKTCAS